MKTIMKKRYIKPEIDKLTTGPLLDLPLTSVGMEGSVTGQNDTGWEFGDDGNASDIPDAKTSSLIPDHFSNIWGDEEE